MLPTQRRFKRSPLSLQVHHLCWVFASLLLPVSAVLAQQAEPAFEVVSIRQNLGSSGQPGPAGTTAAGWHMINRPMIEALLTAYVPADGTALMYTAHTLSGLPDWLSDERYDIEARVSEADLPAWTNPATQQTMLHTMLQQALADRLKLVVHRESRDVSVFNLVLVKGGPKFAKTDPAATHPIGMPVPAGGTLVVEDGGRTMHFFGSPVSAVAVILSNVSGRPVQDKTGLTGLYDIAVHRPAIGTQVSSSVEDPNAPPNLSSVVEDLGLKLVSAKGSVETLVVDHIEKPSQN